MKPLLYHDIDGVLFGDYGPRRARQIRPGLGDWFHWVLARYQIVFLSSWKHHEILTVLHELYLRDVIPQCRYLEWEHAIRPIPFKWDAVVQDQLRQPHPYLWIDDDDQVFPEKMERGAFYSGIPFVRVNPTGEHELLHLMQRLNARTTKLHALLDRRHQARPQSQALVAE